MLQARHFSTAAIVGALPLDHRFGLGRGFAMYDDDFGTSLLNRPRRPSARPAPGRWLTHEYTVFERPADEVTERAIRWLSKRRGPWFLFVHYFDAHSPYEPDESWRQRFPFDYDGEIAFVDEQVGRLLEHVRTMNGRTLVVLTADHGESLGEHGEANHNRFVYDATQWVPLVVLLEGVIPPGKRITTPVSHVDIFPTILSLLGLRQPRDRPGRSLRDMMLGDTAVSNGPIYAETMVWKLENRQGIEVRSLILEPLKVIWTRHTRPESIREEWELFDRRADSRELRNIFDPQVPAHRMLREKLARLSAQLEVHAPQPRSVRLDPESLKNLRNLGYLGGH